MTKKQALILMEDRLLHISQCNGEVWKDRYVQRALGWIEGVLEEMKGKRS